MGNAIRELKVEISGIDIDMIEQDVRDVHQPFSKIFNFLNRPKMHYV